MPEQHAILSASGAHRWLHCTPSARLETQFPDKGSEYATEGTLAHKIAELKVRKYFSVMKPSVFKKELKALQEDPQYKPEMDVHTDAYLDYIKDLATSFKSKPYVAVEQRLDFSNVVPDGFGTGDCVIIGGGMLIIVDFKYGQGVPVSAEDNPQMKLYAIGAINAFSMLYDVKTVLMSIFQPRLDNISTSELSSEDLTAWAEEIKPTAQLAHNGEGEFCAGDWCRFCRAKALCKARSAFAQEPYEQFHGFTPPLISSDEVGEILKRADVIKKWIADLEDWALSEILNGGEVAGWKAVEGRSNRKITDVDAAFEILKSNGFDEALLYERKPLTLTGLESLVTKKKLEELVGDKIEKPQGKPTLAPITDKRESITNKITAAEAFSAEKE